MKHIRHYLADARRHQGLALIIVLSMLALATIVILAFLSVADTEMKATNIYSASQTSRRFADTAVNMVISQIRSGSARETAGVPVIHATQPGAVRKYSQAGTFLAGYKLFSDKDMVFRALGGTVNQREQEFVSSSEPPVGWNEGANKARYVDLNEPVVKGVAAATGNNARTQVFFPIIDPRAGQDIDSSNQEIPVEGFSYETTTALNNYNIGTAADGEDTQPILKPSDATRGAVDQLRLAMPVQWLYLLKDGAVGYLNEGLQFRVLNNDQAGVGDGPSSTSTDQYGVPSETNPIVGRVAFWTDDETCKININTAAEPTFAGQPIYYHERDHRWADYPPTRSEYQRFPGHPATVALSSVFYPNPLQSANRSLDTYGPTGPVSGQDLTRALDVKARIYELMPRIHTGGSVAGTRTFEQDDYLASSGDSTDAASVEIEKALTERLYASVDELLFSQTDNGSQRVLNNANVGTDITLFSKTSLERSSAFLTASSRGSEINLFGLPRIAMWPIDEQVSKRTGFDRLIEFCSRVGTPANSYIFQRANSHTIPGRVNGATYDISITRNQSLLRMLDSLLGSTFPTASTDGNGTARSFVDKLGQDNSRQLLVSMFDYIRCTNLYDSFLVKQKRDDWPSASITWNNSTRNLYHVRDDEEGNYNTYTPGVVRNILTTSNSTGNKRIDDPFEDRFLPGHGQVTPSESPIWTIGGSPVRGFGRFISISEIGLHFICTADGQPDMYSWRLPVKDTRPTAQPGDFIIPEIAPASFDANTTGSIPLISGGRTALKVKEENLNGFFIEHGFPNGFDGTQARLKNVDAIHWRNGADGAPANSIKERYYSNYPPLSDATIGGRYGTTTIASQPTDANYGRYFRLHPGYDWKNWNWTLPVDSDPLTAQQKQIQAMLHLEFFCPSVAYTEITPDYTIILSGSEVSNIQVNGRAVFSTTEDIVLRSSNPLYETDSHPEIGGYASFRNVALGRRVGGVAPMPEDNGFDTSASSQRHGGLLNLKLVSSFFRVTRNEPLEFSSGTIRIKVYDHHVLAGTTEEPVQVIDFKLSKGKAPSPDIVTVGSYLVNYQQSNGSTYNHPAVQAPRWWSFSRDGALARFDNLGGKTDMDNAIYRSIRGRFYNWDGVSVNNTTRAVDPRISDSTNTKNQSVPGARALIYTKDPANYRSVELQSHQLLVDQPLTRIGYGPLNDPQNAGSSAVVDKESWDIPWHYGSDTVRTIQPATGDARLIAVKKHVPAEDWTPHRLWNNENEYMAHNFSSYTAGTEAGFDRGTSNTDTAVDNTVRGLPAKVTVAAARSPDAPHGRSEYAPTAKAAHEYIQRYYDFDDCDPGGRVGPYINKVDEGNYAVGDYLLSGWPASKKWRSTYYRSDSQGARYASGKGSYFTPNRMVTSPVVMGSLPSRVWDSNGSGAWTNLLFRPYLSYPSSETGSTSAAAGSHPGEASPPDHYLLDLFWMPIVEPYAISESLSTAGKINLNYQIMPFTHIRRATALHAAMKGELMAALPNADYDNSKGMYKGWGLNGSTAPIFRGESSDAQSKYWHRGIVVDRFKPDTTLWWQQNLNERVQGTLREFEERFNFGVGASGGALPAGFRGGLFRTTSQICEVHLIPTPVTGISTAANVSASDVSNYASRVDNLARFWAEHCSTGDNTRERPYANLYQKFTTRSNTFRVHVRAQSIRKALRSVAADTFDPALDQVSAEFRGSFLLERYIDQADLAAANPTDIDYAAATNPFSLKPLENYYRFRILESKRFAP